MASNQSFIPLEDRPTSGKSSSSGGPWKAIAFVAGAIAVLFIALFAWKASSSSSSNSNNGVMDPNYKPLDASVQQMIRSNMNSSAQPCEDFYSVRFGIHAC